MHRLETLFCIPCALPLACTLDRLPPPQYGNLVIMPGLIDPHVHLNVPGADSEGVGSGTAAAAAGGTTTLLDMPLNSVPSTISLPTLQAKVEAFAADPPTVDVGFIGGAVGDGGGQTPADVVSLVVAGGVFALKSFLVDSQSPNFPHVSLPQMRAVMDGLTALGNRSVPYILHAELPPNVSPSGAEGGEGSIGQDYPGDGTSLVDWAASRPHSWEVDAVRAVVTAAAAAGVPAVHVAHVASAEAAAVVAEAAAAAAALSAVAAVGGHWAGVAPRITAETCPHYLLWAAEEVDAATAANGAAATASRPLWKCAPPIRDAGNRAALWQALLPAAGTGGLAMVGSDHSPADDAARRLATGDVRGAWGGIAGLQYRLHGTWGAAVAAGGVDLPTLSHWLSGAAADAFGLAPVKGRITAGADADVVVWDPDVPADLGTGACRHRHLASPYHADGRPRGRVAATFVRGTLVFRAPAEGEGDGTAADVALPMVQGAGRLLRRMPVGGLARLAAADWW